jgi:hypothetical protein
MRKLETLVKLLTEKYEAKITTEEMELLLDEGYGVARCAYCGKATFDDASYEHDTEGNQVCDKCLMKFEAWYLPDFEVVVKTKQTLRKYWNEHIGLEIQGITDIRGFEIPA